MKKIVVLLGSVVLFTLSAQAQKYQDPPMLKQLLLSAQKQAEQKRIAMARLYNDKSIEQNTTVHFRVQENLIDINTDISLGKYQADIFCKAYPLDAHWLVVANSCLDISNEDVFERNDHEYIVRERVGEELVSVGGKNIGTRAVYRQGNLMLIRLHEGVYKAPYVHLLAVSSPDQLFALGRGNEVKVNSSHLALWSDHIRSRVFNTNSANGKNFTLNKKPFDLPGTATDPLFVISNADKHEVLVAYNQGKITYSLFVSGNDILQTSHTNPSADWKILDEEDLQFVKETVSQQEPAAWERVKKRLFFNNMNKPFFD